MHRDQYWFVFGTGDVSISGSITTVTCGDFPGRGNDGFDTASVDSSVDSAAFAPGGRAGGTCIHRRRSGAAVRAGPGASGAAIPLASLAVFSILSDDCAISGSGSVTTQRTKFCRVRS